MDIKSIIPILIIARLMAIFIILRSVNIWYCKIDESSNNQKKIIDLLEIKNKI